jgi:hypothetical protein
MIRRAGAVPLRHALEFSFDQRGAMFLLLRKRRFDECPNADPLADRHQTVQRRAV